MRVFRKTGLASMLAIALVLITPWSMAEEMKIGIGRTIITPQSPVWMAGYASRTEPGAGKVHDLWAKAMAMEDAQGTIAVIITTDLIGLTAGITDGVSKRIEEAHGIPRGNLMYNASHTHSGPVVRDNALFHMYGLDKENTDRAIAYTQKLNEWLFQTIDTAIKDLQPGTLSWAIGEASFGKNRRQFNPNGGVSNGFNPIGPVDHDVPTLLAKDAKGGIKGILFGYACHCTTVGFQEYSGDYAGYAQIHVENAYPGATALFAAGCGADQNPLPRRKLELAEKYGAELGHAVEAVVDNAMTPVTGPIETNYKTIQLELTKAPTLEEVEKTLTHSNKYEVRRAKKLQQLYKDNGKLSETLPYPIQVWKLGETVQMTALAGEVVVDYSRLIKYHYPAEKQFVLGYSNDCLAYIPSLRVLQEGGYEGGGAMLYYGIHGPFKHSVQNDIMNTIKELAGPPTTP